MSHELPSLAALGPVLPHAAAEVGVRTKAAPAKRQCPGPESSTDDAVTARLPPPATVNGPCPDLPSLEPRPSGLTGAGLGLFTTVEIPAFSIFAEYHGPVGTHADVCASCNQDMYAGTLPNAAVLLDGNPVLPGMPAVDTVLPDPLQCKAARANMIPVAMARDPSNPLSNNALLVSSTDKQLQGVLDSRYLRDRHAERYVGSEAGASSTPQMYACDRIYLWAICPIPANTEIFLDYGGKYANWNPDA